MASRLRSMDGSRFTATMTIAPSPWTTITWHPATIPLLAPLPTPPFAVPIALLAPPVVVLFALLAPLYAVLNVSELSAVVGWEEVSGVRSARCVPSVPERVK